MKSKTKIFICGIASLLLMVTSVFVVNINSNGESIQTNSNLELSNSKIEWGIKRSDNNEQPELGIKNKELIEKYNGIAMGNAEKKYIYITFDLGYEAGYTANILDVLKENNVQATFFITAHYLNSATDLVERMINEGHIVGNHTVNHKSMPQLSDEGIKTELMDLHQSIYEKFNYEMKYMRPPCGEFSERSLNATKELGYKTVMWSFAYVDWEENKQPAHEEAMKKIMNNLHNGEIMLLHATSKTNSEIMDQMIKKIAEEGYEIRSIDDFVQ